MDKITEKFGAFDILVTAFPGAYFILMAKNIYHFFKELVVLPQLQKINIFDIFCFWEFDLYLPRTLFEFISFSFVSYFVGIILQELASIMKKKVIYSNGKPHCCLLDPTNGPLNAEEIVHFTAMFERISGRQAIVSLDPQEKSKLSGIIFHEVNADCQKNSLASKYAKLSIISNMAVNLFVSNVILLAIIVLYYFHFLFSGLYSSMIRAVAIPFYLIVSSYLFYQRGNKYNERWIKNLLYAYKTR